MGAAHGKKNGDRHQERSPFCVLRLARSFRFLRRVLAVITRSVALLPSEARGSRRVLSDLRAQAAERRLGFRDFALSGIEPTRELVALVRLHTRQARLASEACLATRKGAIRPCAARHWKNVVLGQGLSPGDASPLATTRAVEERGTQQLWGVLLRLGRMSGLWSHHGGTAGRVCLSICARMMNGVVACQRKWRCSPAALRVGL
jgi:hypothetical protein